MRGLEKVDMKRGQIYRQIYRQTDIATTIKNWPKGRFFENPATLINLYGSNNKKVNYNS